MWWSWPLELLQRAGVSVWVGGGWRGQLLGLQAVGEGVQVFHQETHHQHVLLCRTEGFLKRQPVTKCYTNTWQPISSWFQRTANHNAPQSKSSQTITRGSERFVFDWVQRSHTCQSFGSYSVKSAISMILVLKSCWCSTSHPLFHLQILTVLILIFILILLLVIKWFHLQSAGKLVSVTQNFLWIDSLLFIIIIDLFLIQSGGCKLLQTKQGAPDI